MTDDNYVMLVSHKYNCVNSIGYETVIYNTAIVRFTNFHQRNPKFSLLVADRLDMKHLGDIGFPMRKQLKASIRERRWFDLVLNGHPPEKAFRMIFTDAKSPQYIKQRTKTLLKSERIASYMEEKTKDVLAQLGLDKTWVAQQLKEMGEDKNTPASVRLSAIQDVGKLLDMYPKTGGISRLGMGFGQLVLADGEIQQLEEHEEAIDTEVTDEQEVEQP